MFSHSVGVKLTSSVFAGHNFAKISYIVVTSVTISPTGLQVLEIAYVDGVRPLLLSWWPLEWVLLLLLLGPPWHNQLGGKRIAAPSVGAPVPPVSSGTLYLGISAVPFTLRAVMEKTATSMPEQS